jgi:lysozyme
MNLERLADKLIAHEALRLKPYKCSAGKLTIGVGRNLEDRGITKEEALFLLMNDIKISIQEAGKFPFFASLNDTRQEIIVNMLFNIGYGRLSGFRKFLDALTLGDYQKASKEMLDSVWAKQVGRRAQELSDAMAKGHW